MYLDQPLSTKGEGRPLLAIPVAAERPSAMALDLRAITVYLWDLNVTIQRKPPTL